MVYYTALLFIMYFICTYYVFRYPALYFVRVPRTSTLNALCTLYPGGPTGGWDRHPRVKQQGSWIWGVLGGGAPPENF